MNLKILGGFLSLMFLSLMTGCEEQSVASTPDGMEGYIELVEGKNTGIDGSAPGYYFAPKENGFYTLDSFAVLVGLKTYSINGEFCYYLEAGNPYSVDINGNTEINIFKNIYPTLTLNTPNAVTTGTIYLLSIPADGCYDFVSAKGRNNFEMTNSKTYTRGGTSAMGMTSGRWLIYFYGDDDITISEVTPSLLTIGAANKVTNGVYSFTVSENVYYNVVFENGTVNNGLSGLNYLRADNTNYLKFEQYNSEVEGTITITPVNISNATPISVGDEISVTAGTLYSVALTENVPYRLVTSEECEFFTYINICCEKDSDALFTEKNIYLRTTATYYFIPTENATFTIINVFDKASTK